jgi:hypothetical protein
VFYGTEAQSLGLREHRSRVLREILTLADLPKKRATGHTGGAKFHALETSPLDTGERQSSRPAWFTTHPQRNPRTLGPMTSKHANHYTTEATIITIIIHISFLTLIDDVVTRQTFQEERVTKGEVTEEIIQWHCFNCTGYIKPGLRTVNRRKYATGEHGILQVSSH